jgi:hypothetical protein
MDEAAGDKPVILVLLIDSRRPEDQFIDHFSITETGKGNHSRQKDNADRDVEHAASTGAKDIL